MSIRSSAAAAAGILVLAACSAPAGADWSRADLPIDPSDTAHDAALTASGETVVLSTHYPGAQADVILPDGVAEPPQVLDTGPAYYPAVAASAAGGAVAAWTTGSELRIVQRPAAGGLFAPAATSPSGNSDYSYDRPIVRVNESGAAIVVWLSWDGFVQTLQSRYRPPGGSFGPAEQIGLPGARDGLFPRDVALGPDGTAVVGFVRDGTSRVAVRPPGGPWQPEAQVGSATSEHSWNAPRVGVDRFGDVVAVWLDGGDTNDTGPVGVAFRRAGDAAFGPPVDTNLRANEIDRIGLGVSSAGEVVLVVEAETTNPYGGTHIEGLHAAMGNARTGQLGPEQAITGIWGGYPSFAMNERGDAAVVWSECCPMAVRARRRAALSSFGHAEDVQPPIDFTGSRNGIIVRTADVDERGNAETTYEDGELDKAYRALSAPWQTEDPAPVTDIGDGIAPVLGPDEQPAPPAPSSAPASTPPPPPPSAGSQPVSDSSVAPLPDTAPPGLTLRVARALAGRAHPRLVASVRCSETCTLRLSARFGHRALRPVDVRLASDASMRVGLVVRRADARRPEIARLAAVAVDAAGNTSRRRISVQVRRMRGA